MAHSLSGVKIKDELKQYGFAFKGKPFTDTVVQA